MCGISLVADARGRRSHELVQQALSSLVRLTHRGAPSDTASIDGAGVLTQIPWEVFADDLPAAFAAAGVPRALGMFFLPRHHATELKRTIEHALARAGFGTYHWRTVPVSFEAFASSRRKHMPTIVQVAALGDGTVADPDAALYRARIRIETAAAGRDGWDGFAVVSLSTRTVVYKGLLTPSELPIFYPDLRDAAFRSSIAIAHQRFSTNTVAQWSLAQPFGVLAHNGEISTIEGNRRSMGARLRAARIPTLLGTPADSRASDSSSLDAAVRALCSSGLSVPHALARLIPPAWEHDTSLDPAVAAFYEYQARFTEPWDGPAAIAFTDGVVAGALLDRNGFRPARYVRTRDGGVFLGSEAGIFDVPERDVLERGRLAPGGLLIVDTRTGDVLDTAVARRQLAAARPYQTFAAAAFVAPDSLGAVHTGVGPLDPASLRRAQVRFGYTQEEIDLILRPMADGAEPMGSMGDDAPQAAFSRMNRVLPDYFRQRFAQVTNPPMDPLRERCVMSLRVTIGTKAAASDERNVDGPVVALPSPIVDEATFERLAGAAFLRPVTLPLVFAHGDDAHGLERTLDDLVRHAADAVARGTRLLILSDRGASDRGVPIPPLLATAAIREGLAIVGLATRASLLVETGEARDAHQVATLLAFGASAVMPYLAFETAAQLSGGTDPSADRAARFRASLDHGLLKILSKMGVTTAAGYCGSGLFDVIGLDRELVRRWFHGNGGAEGGLTIADIARHGLQRHGEATAGSGAVLRYPGLHSFRRGGEQHAFEPAVVRQLHKAAQPDESAAYGAFTSLVTSRQPVAIRDFLAWKTRKPVPIDEVELEDGIVRRFFTAAMSVGALSPEAHETLAVAMNRLGGRSNSGEGGESPERFARETGREWRGSAIKQVASARFGVTPGYLRSATELQIKIAQGSKPGEGGQLPAAKVSDEIARLRYAQPGITLISPPVHHDIYSIEDLAQLIFDLRQFHPAARIGVKLVAGAGVGLVAAGAAKAGADAILISGHDGGTGASPRGSIKHAGFPWEIGLAEAHRALTLHGLRNRVVLQVDGGMQCGRDVAIAAALGADEFGFGTAALVAIGCVMARQCHLDTCPAGIATQRRDLRAKFKGTPEMAERFLRLVAADVRQTLAALGLSSLSQLVGRADLLRPRDGTRCAELPDLRKVIGTGGAAAKGKLSLCSMQPQLDEIDLPDALASGRSVIINRTISNVDRTVGAALSGRITAKFGERGLPPASIALNLTGTAGQSLGAFLVPGIDIHLRGEANDYVCKGMHGGTVSIRPLDDSAVRGTDVIAGNAVLYGATGGSLFIRGAAGERFAVRNSGATAVVEGVGDHGCEYMTGGVVVVLGPVGRNFGSGMSGGVAFVLDDTGSGVALEPADCQLLDELLATHWKLTGSTIAARLLGEQSAAVTRFRKIGSRTAPQRLRNGSVTAPQPQPDNVSSPHESQEIRRSGVVG